MWFKIADKESRLPKQKLKNSVRDRMSKLSNDQSKSVFHREKIEMKIDLFEKSKECNKD